MWRALHLLLNGLRPNQAPTLDHRTLHRVHAPSFPPLCSALVQGRRGAFGFQPADFGKLMLLFCFRKDTLTKERATLFPSYVTSCSRT